MTAQTPEQAARDGNDREDLAVPPPGAAPTLGEIFWDDYRGATRTSGWVVPHSPFSQISDSHRAAVEAGAQAVADHLRSEKAARAAPGRVPQMVLSEATLGAVQAEATRARLKHGDHSMLGANYSNGDRLAILMEEVGEVAHELTYDQGGGEGRRDELVKELIQVAAMAATWVECLEARHR